MKKTLAILGATSALALMTAANAGEIKGKVTDGSQSVPLNGAKVVVKQTGQRVTTDRDGSFRLTGLEAGAYDITVTYTGAPSTSVNVNLANDDAVTTVTVTVGKDEGDIVYVYGQRGALNSALSQQRAADGVVSVLSSDAVGQLPDENVAEAARRAPGINVLNDQGEGRYISIRGIDPNLVSTSINGVRLTSPEGGDRQVALDVIDADLLKNIIISKSLTPEMDADTIGGNVEIETLSGLDQEDMLFKAKIAGLYSDLQEEYGEKASFTYANNYGDGLLGVAASASWQSRKFGSENKEADDGEWNFDNAVAFPEELELRDYQVQRDRLSIALNLDSQLDDNTRVYLHTLFSEFEDEEVRSRVENKFGDLGFARAEGSVAIFESSAKDKFEVDRDVKDRLETQTIFSSILGAEHLIGRGTFDWSVSITQSEEAEPNRLDSDFRAKLDGEYGVDTSDLTNPRLAALDADYFDASKYEFDGLEQVDGLSKDDEWAIAANYRHDVDFGENPGYLKAGVKARLREKTRDVDVKVYGDYDGADDLLLSQFAAEQDYGLDRLGITPDAAAIRKFFNANRSNFELEELDSQVASALEDYTADEDIYAAYAMGSVDINNLRLVGGVRVERTEFDAIGNSVVVADEDAVVNGVTLTEDTAIVSRLETENEYTDVLPSITARFDATDEVVVRGGYYASVVRPNISSVVPSVEFEQDDDNEVEASFGNPTLDRQKADNLDFSVEYYPGNKSVVSAGVFYKRIEDFIATQRVEGDLPADRAILDRVPLADKFDFSNVEKFEISFDTNLDDVNLWGIELNYQQPLDMLPAPFDGMIVGANYTYVNADVEVEGRKIKLPKQSENIANLLIGYDKGRYDLRFAASYRDEYIDEIGLDKAADRVVTDHIQLDFKGKVALNDNWKAFVQLKNINDRPFEAVSRFKSRSGDYLNQLEEYGWSAQFGLTFKN